MAPCPIRFPCILALIFAFGFVFLLTFAFALIGDEFCIDADGFGRWERGYKFGTMLMKFYWQQKIIWFGFRDFGVGFCMNKERGYYYQIFIHSFNLILRTEYKINKFALDYNNKQQNNSQKQQNPTTKPLRTNQQHHHHSNSHHLPRTHSHSTLPFKHIIILITMQPPKKMNPKAYCYKNINNLYYLGQNFQQGGYGCIFYGIEKNEENDAILDQIAKFLKQGKLGKRDTFETKGERKSAKGEKGLNQDERAIVEKGVKNLKAIKIIDLKLAKSQIKKSLQNESKTTQALQKCQTSTIIKLHQTLKSPSELRMLILQLCQYSSLQQLIFHKGHLKQPQAKIYLKNILTGLMSMHHIHFAHRDLKASNVCFLNDCCKLIDFGCSKEGVNTGVGERFGKTMGKMTTITGTVYTKPPEMLKGEKYTYRADFWAIGILYYQMLTGIFPFPVSSQYPNAKNLSLIESNLHQIYNPDYISSQVKAQYPNYQIYRFIACKKISPAARSFLQKLICLDPQKRMNQQQMKQCPYLQQEWDIRYRLGNGVKEGNLDIWDAALCVLPVREQKWKDIVEKIKGVEQSKRDRVNRDLVRSGIQSISHYYKARIFQDLVEQEKPAKLTEQQIQQKRSKQLSLKLTQLLEVQQSCYTQCQNSPKLKKTQSSSQYSQTQSSTTSHSPTSNQSFSLSPRSYSENFTTLTFSLYNNNEKQAQNENEHENEPVFYQMKKQHKQALNELFIQKKLADKNKYNKLKTYYFQVKRIKLLVDFLLFFQGVFKKLSDREKRMDDRQKKKDQQKEIRNVVSSGYGGFLQLKQQLLHYCLEKAALINGAARIMNIGLYSNVVSSKFNRAFLTTYLQNLYFQNILYENLAPNPLSPVSSKQKINIEPLCKNFSTFVTSMKKIRNSNPNDSSESGSLLESFGLHQQKQKDYKILLDQPYKILKFNYDPKQKGHQFWLSWHCFGYLKSEQKV